jgi:hypothetical protein
MRRTSILILILFSIFVTTIVFADVNVNLPNASAYPNDRLRVPVAVSSLTGLGIYSYQFKMKYDSAVVKAIGVDSAKTLTAAWGMTWTNLETPGEAIIGNYDVNPLQNTGVLIYVLFDIIGEIDDSTRLTFQSFEFNAGQPTVKLTNGSIKILHPPVKVFFNTIAVASIKIQVDGIEKKLPFDTTWAYGSFHSIGTSSTQYKTADFRFTFKSWSDGGDMFHSVVPRSDTTFTLNMNEECLLTVNSAYGSVQGNGWYVKETTALFSVDSLAQESDSTRYIFNMWNGAGNSAYTGTQRIVNIVMNSPIVETAKWTLQYHLKINAPYGNPVGVGWHDQGDTVVIGIDSLFSPVTGTRYIFDSWQGKGTGSYSGNKRNARVVLLAPIFEQPAWQTEYYLWIKSNPAGIINFERSGWYAKHQTVITDTAKQYINLPEISCHFQRWSVDGQSVAGNPTQILMDTSHTAEVLYQIDSVLVTINTNIGVGTSIFVDRNRYAAPYSRFWSSQSVHLVGTDTIQYTPDLKTRYRFESWSDGGAQQHVIQADTVFKLTALLSTQHYLSVDTHPTGLIEFSVMGWHDEGITVTLSKVPEQVNIGQETFSFKGWSVDKESVAGNPINVVMDKPHSAIALYTDLYFISGKITDRNRHSIPNTTVTLSGASQDTFKITTGNEYYFNFLIQGDYQVTPYLDGFQFEPPYRGYASLNNSSSDQNFVATDTLKPKINLVYPNGGEILKSATTDTIIWQANDNMGIDTIAIDLSLDNGNGWQVIARLSQADNQYYTWNVPDVSSLQCKIRIQVVDFDGNRTYDTSDSPFSISNSSTIENTGNEKRPTKFEVQQNYPNPFNNSTIIRFQIPETAHVKLTIFNMRGQEIMTLLDQKLNAGYHQVKWDGIDQFGKLVSSGVYFYQAVTPCEVVIRRLLYLR